MVTAKQSSPSLVIVQRSLEPRQVNNFQSPVFTVSVRNEGQAIVEVLQSTRLWIVDYESDPSRGMAALLDAPAAILPGREAVIRFLPVRVQIPKINGGVFPLRIKFDVSVNGGRETFTSISYENCVRVGGNSGIAPVESIAMGISPGQTMVIGRAGGYLEVPVIMQDMFPVDVTLKWIWPSVGWRIFTDDGLDFIANPEVKLRQVRAWAPVGVWVEPTASIPANEAQMIGALVAARCPVDNQGGFGACIGAGGRVFAVVAESAAVQMGVPSAAVIAVSRGAQLDVEATLVNPFHYRVDIANFGRASLLAPRSDIFNDENIATNFVVESSSRAISSHDAVGVRVLQSGTEIQDVLRFVAMIAPDYLEAKESRTVGWRIEINGNAPLGRYRLQPFTTATVWLTGRFKAFSKLEARIDPGAADPGFGVEIEVT